MDVLQLPLELVKSGEVAASLKKQVLDLVYPHQDHSRFTKFPGAQPAELSRSEFERLRSEKYWVAEKSDGVRGMLLSTEQGMYLVDRRFDFYAINSQPRFFLPDARNTDRPQHQTLLDGEMTYNFHYNKYCFMVFDVIAISGESKMENALPKRLEVIRDEVVLPFRKKYDSNLASAPFIFLGKEFFPFERIAYILQRISYFPPDPAAGETFPRYVYQSEKRYNDNDGLIFTPENQPFKAVGLNGIFKWKWPNLQTVDFLLRVEERTNKFGNISKDFVLYLQGNGGLLIKFQKAKFPNDIRKRIWRILEERDSKEVIVELAFDPKLGEWKYYKARTDKTDPNYVVIAMLTLQSAAENITKEELIKFAEELRHGASPSGGYSRQHPTGGHLNVPARGGNYRSPSSTHRSPNEQRSTERSPASVANAVTPAWDTLETVVPSEPSGEESPQQLFGQVTGHKRTYDEVETSEPSKCLEEPKDELEHAAKRPKIDVSPIAE